MRELTVDGHRFEVRVTPTGRGGGPTVALSAKPVGGSEGITVNVSATELRMLMELLNHALTDSEGLWDGDHRGGHPNHDPVANPDTLSHRPAIGGAPTGDAELSRSPSHETEPAV